MANLDGPVTDEAAEGRPVSNRRPGYFNGDNYYSFEGDRDSVTILSECCSDTLDRDAAVELRRLLDLYIGWTDGN